MRSGAEAALSRGALPANGDAAMTQVPDLYGRYHKGLRRALALLLADLGACDPADAEAWQVIVAAWGGLREAIVLHEAREDSHLQPLVRHASPELAAYLDAQHRSLEITVAHLDRLFDAVPKAGDGRASAQALYLRLSGFLADYFQHLLVEEEAAMPALAARFPAETLAATQRTMIAAIPSARRMADLALMKPALRPDECAGLPGA